MRSSSRLDPRRGVVLVAVLWTIALLSTLAMAAGAGFRGFAGVLAVDRDRVQAEALFTAGMEAGADLLTKYHGRPLLPVETRISLRRARGACGSATSSAGSTSTRRRWRFSLRSSPRSARPTPARSLAPSCCGATVS